MSAVLAALVLVSRAASAAGELEPPARVGDAPVAYPAAGRGDATVTLVVVVDVDGTVAEPSVRRGAEPFASAAAASVKAWRFVPARRNGTSVAARITVVVDFHDPAAKGPPLPAAPASRAGASVPHPGSEEVSVRGARAREETGTIRIPRSDARFIPGAFGDPFRVIEALPGMAPWLSGLPYYYVRGSPPENVGYTIDGIRIPLLFHTGAGPSVIAPALVDSVDLFPGAYPARYGRFAGAIIAGETAPAQTDRPRAEFGARLFDANAFGEVPYDGGRGSITAATRYGYTGLLTSLLAPDYSLGYWDYQARATHKTWGRDTVSILVFGAHDNGSYQGQELFRVEYHRADLRYDHVLPGGNLRVAATLSTDQSFTALKTPSGAGESASLRGPGGRLRAEIEERIAPGVLVRAGADLGAVRFDVDDYGPLHRPPHTDIEGGAYADAVWRPSERVEVVPGIRLDGYETRGVTGLAPQPRLGARIRLAPGVALISALGVAHQEPTEGVFVPAKLPDPIDEASRDSYQYSEAIDVRLPSSMRLRVTGFYTKLVAESVGGQEQNEGLEVFAERDFTRRLGGFLAYTLSRSDTTGEPLQNTLTTRSSWDRTHVLSTVLSYDLGRGWRAGARFFFESGRPYPLVCDSPTCAPVGSHREAQLVGETLPPFYRVDLRVEKRWTFRDGKWLAATLECFNTLDKAEPIGLSYGPSTGLTTRYESPLILPSIGLEGGI
jgi:hypothetical protein